MHNRTLKNLLSKLPPEAVWMLAVDGKFHATENGPDGYDSREPKSVEGVIKGLAVALDNLEEELTVDRIRATHLACMDGVKSKNLCEPGQFRKNPVMSEIKPEHATLQGLRYFLTKCTKPKIIYTNYAFKNEQPFPLKQLPPEEKKPPYLKYCFLLDYDIQLRLSQLEDKDFMTEFNSVNIALQYQHDKLDISNIPREVEKHVNIFNRNIKDAVTQKEKLQAIIKVIQDILREVHPFRDGNNRLFVNCILQRLLIKHVGKLALFYDPNVFEGYSPDELIKVVEEAMNKAEKMLQNPKEPVFGFDNSKLNKRYVVIGKIFLNKFNHILTTNYPESVFLKIDSDQLFFNKYLSSMEKYEDPKPYFRKIQEQTAESNRIRFTSSLMTFWSHQEEPAIIADSPTKCIKLFSC